ncbi:MAG: two-component sensor histidine kinase [Frankiales bacterium]|jgi:signal transduction histidine kinase|nr:two-component sensor histidine kinase [Frankiales bacterium]
MGELVAVDAARVRPEGGPEATRLAHFADAESVLDQLESRQAERRSLDRRSPVGRKARASDDPWSQRSRELCHDMRQPLAVIASVLADIDPERLSGSERDRLEQVRVEAERLSMFVVGCLSPPRQERVDLHRVVQAVARSSSITFEGALEFVGSDEPVVVGDPTALDRALSNVLDNACRAAGPDGLVRVVVWSATDGAHIDIDDDGPGLGRSAGAGHGLGLAIVSAVLDQHGGTLATGPGVLGGTRVRLRLPLAVPAARCVGSP